MTENRQRLLDPLRTLEETYPGFLLQITARRTGVEMYPDAGMAYIGLEVFERDMAWSVAHVLALLNNGVKPGRPITREMQRRANVTVREWLGRGPLSASQS